jgi:hypothetical protein
MGYQLTSGASIIRSDDGAIIPVAPENTDYQAYLVWISEGNTPIEAAAPAAAQLWVEYQAAAQVLLDKSNVVILQCYEAGVPVPAEWVAYRKNLRAIIEANSGDPTIALPTQPEKYPADT